MSMTLRDYVEDVLQNGENHTMPPSIRKAKSIVSAIPVSSAVAERGFSKMNGIYSDKRSIHILYSIKT